jgi:SAM-dependent methyltransferase
MGRLTIPLARMGMAMTGVDLTASYLRRARRRARQEGLDVRFIHADMRDIAFEGEFDAAFNWFGSFGYFTDEGNLAFCRRVLHALRPGGRFLVEGINRSWLLAHYRPHTEQTLGGVHIDQRNRWDARAGRVHSTWTFRKGQARERRHVRIRIYNGTELRALLRSAGFRDVELFTHSPFGRLTRHSRRLIAVGTRPMGGRS